jgi:hypothetical protein
MMEVVENNFELVLSDAHYQFVLEYVSQAEAFEAACIDNFLSRKERD